LAKKLTGKVGQTGHKVKNIMRWLRKGRIRFLRGQRGISLIETLIGLALLGIIAVAFLNGLSTTSRGVMISQESVAAESLAKSQIERIKAQPYILVADYDPATNCYEKIDIPADLDGEYDIEINPPAAIISPPEGGFELQSITVVIKRNGEGMFTVSCYRCGEST